MQPGLLQQCYLYLNVAHLFPALHVTPLAAIGGLEGLPAQAGVQAGIRAKLGSANVATIRAKYHTA